MNDPFVRQVREAVDLVEVVGQYVELKKAGRAFKGRCPFHEEKTPSFNVNPDQQLFYCFGCQKGGDVFKFLMELEGVTFPEALERLARKAGIAMPERRRPGPRETGLAEVVEFAVTYYQEELLHAERGREGRDYLKSRGVRAETALEWRLGLAGAGWENLVRAAGSRFEPRLLLEAGLCVQRDGGQGVYDRLRRRVVFPIASVGGVWVGLGGRALADGEVKYLNTADSPLYHKSSVLYGLHQARISIRQTQRALLVEGYLDVLTLHQAGFREAVASSGTALTVEHAQLLRRFADQVTVVYDGDDAGRNAAFRCLRPLLKAGIRPRIALLPAGADPDSLVRSQGPAAFSRALEEAEDWLPAVRRHPGLPDRLESRMDAVATLIAESEDALLRSTFVKEAAQEFSFFEDALRGAVEQRRNAAASRGGAQRPVLRGPVAASGPARTVLKWLVHRPDLLDALDPPIRPGWFETPEEGAAFESVMHFAREPLAEPDPVIAALAAEPPEDSFQVESGLKAAALRLEERWLRREMPRLRGALHDVQDPAEKMRMLQQILAYEQRSQELNALARDSQFESLSPMHEDRPAGH